MEEEFKRYLKSIGFSAFLINRTSEIREYVEDIFHERINDIFVEDYYTTSGREYDSLYFLTENNLMIDAKNFRNNDSLLITSLSLHVSSLKINFADYNLKNETYTKQSKFIVEFVTDLKVYGELKSSGNNCNQLKMILSKYLIPNLKQ